MNRTNVDSPRTITCQTPMQKIRQNFNINLQNNDEDSFDFAESLSEFLGLTWNIWGVTSLFGFQQDSEVVLKQYAKKLREEVASILPVDNVSYDCNFIILDRITPRPCNSDLPPIKITITANLEDDKIKNIYTGIMMSWRTDVPEINYDESIKLPILLCRGTKSGMNAVHTVLGNMFDCQIVELSATEEDLKWLVPIVLNPSGDAVNDKGDVKFEYKIPGLSSSDSITTKNNTKDLIKLWNAVIEDNDDDDVDDNDSNENDNNFKVEHVEMFFQVLHNQMLMVSGLQLGLCSLSKIILPSFTIMDNRIKTSSSEVLNRVLLFFNQKSLEMLHQLNFTSTNSTTS